jgi:hypothetical protein
MKLDILAFRHTDDVELGCSGNDTKSGLRKKSWDVILTRGVRDSRSAEIRDQEANAAAKF